MITKLRSSVAPLLSRIAERMPSFITPSLLTLLSIPFSFAFLYFVWRQELGLAILTLIISGLLDALDGALARRRGVASRAGALLDASVDRLNDTVYGLSLYFLKVPWEVVYLWITSSLLVSIIRAASEIGGKPMEGKGIMERGDRVIALLLLLLIYSAENNLNLTTFKYTTALAVAVTALIWITVIQRLLSSPPIGFWIGINLSMIIVVLLTKGYANAWGVIGLSGSLATLYVALKGKSLGLNYPLDVRDALIDAIMLLSFIYLNGVLSWLLYSLRLVKYFKELSKQQTSSTQGTQRRAE
jgi:archaetidylinositol phosphate synthase